MTDPIALLNEIKSLMELKGENPFKIRAFDKAALNLAARTDLAERAKAGTLKEIPGIGKGIEDVLQEYLLKGHSTVRDELLKSLPPGLLELAKVPGLGPKKAALVIEELGLQSLGELEYACRENRLIHLKGLGEKLQKKILEGILFMNSNQGLKRFSEVDQFAEELGEFLKKAFPGRRVSETGALRRKLEVLSELEFLIEMEGSENEAVFRARSQEVLASFLKGRTASLPVSFHFCGVQEFGFSLAKTTGTPEHWAALGSPSVHNFVGSAAAEEADFFNRLGLSWIPPESRETGEEIALARSDYFEKLLPWDGVKGVFHNHTNRSDGSATLEEMATAAEKLGYEYLGISDHSETAFYAQGLKLAALEEQEKEVRDVQSRHPKLRIFWGIESDILADGSLDYEDEVLKKFDFVIASVHSRFNMDREAMTARILKAIRNPYTRFLGHATGRLLLGRKGYDLDMPAVIQEAARCDVAIELNANPVRLDIDWRWGPEMRKWKTLTSINPDAHEVAGLEDTKYGVAMARKALFQSAQVVNARSVKDVERWLRRG
jgi:DNA polymerase (family 10)